MTDKQQTAVQWFANQLGITTGTMLEQALAMERDQMIWFASSFEYSCGFDGTEYEAYLSAEDYFTDTYQEDYFTDTYQTEQ